MVTFIDTSALYAVMSVDDPNHDMAKKVWTHILIQKDVIVCTNYILVETFALVQHRLGMEAVQVLQENILPVLSIEWMNSTQHQAAALATLTANRRQLSLVDCASFATMRRLGIRTVFAFDTHFIEQGFDCIP